MTLDEKLVKITPHKRQLAFQSLEFYAFVHFTINSFTDKEWGNGTEDISIFNPSELDANQWVTAIKSAEMKGLILTCKHHDGFCLWPSKYTTHSVKYSPYKNGQGDIVKEVSEACAKHGIKFGIYLSPWDRNNLSYGKGEEYDDYFVNQLTELLTKYGDIFAVWLDGACGEGPDGNKQYYDWERYYDVVRKLQPDACINVCGPDIRWCGNEAGNTRPSEWSVVPLRAKDTEKVASLSQQNDNTEFRERKINAQDMDLGSRRILANEKELIWYPAEVNTSIRPGWFYHTYEDDKVRSLDELIRIYNNSVGGNATFLLNIPPMPNGLFHENDVMRLKEMGDYINKAFSVNLMEKAALYADSVANGCGIENVRYDNYESYYMPQDKNAAVIYVDWDNAINIGHIVLKENITMSQRIESFTVEAKQDGSYTTVYNSTVIGYKKIIPFEELHTNGLRITITDSRMEPTISFLGVFSAS